MQYKKDLFSFSFCVIDTTAILCLIPELLIEKENKSKTIEKPVIPSLWWES